MSGYEAVTDLRFLAEAGISGLIYGPGSIPRSHGAEEYLELDELRLSVKIIALTLANYCGVA
jgi:acetylornithine deacetylase/succinyl-diaminopimelate desuccinylase-like protein